jgi:hypothetical protein
MEKTKIVDGFEMLDDNKDRDGNILQAIIDDVFESDMMSIHRVRENVDARRVYSYIMRQRGYNYSRIGKFIGKDHATIIHYNRDIDFILKGDKLLKEKYLLCKKRFFEDIEKADAIKSESLDQSLQQTICNLHKKTKKLEQQVEYLELRNETLKVKSEEYHKELSQYNPKLNTLYKIVTDRTKPNSVTKLSRRFNTLYNGVYDEVIECY